MSEQKPFSYTRVSSSAAAGSLLPCVCCACVQTQCTLVCVHSAWNGEVKVHYRVLFIVLWNGSVQGCSMFV